MASSNRDLGEAMALRWEREASDRERGADREGSDYSALEKRMLRLQANVYRACASELRIESRKISRG
jgi:hypothetical protein